MNDSELHPPLWRVFGAFAVAPVVAAVGVAFYTPGFYGSPLIVRVAGTFVLALVWGGYFPTLLFGMPAYFLLRKRCQPTLLNCVVVAALVASVPCALLGLLPPDYAYSDGHVTHQNGHTTIWGWLGLAEMVGSMVLLGGITGAVFWAVATNGFKRPKPTVG